MLVTAFVVFIERGQRRITVNYAKRQVGNRIYGGQSSYLFEDKHGQRDSADLCIFADSLPGYFSQLVYQRRLHSLDS